MVKAVVGANWGDEGKGKITDMLAESADVVVRFQGGANAGHTIVNEYGKFALHTVPSGAFHPNIMNIMGAGVAFDIEKFMNEIHSITEKGVPMPQIMISDRAQVMMPYHVALDSLEEAREIAEKAGYPILVKASAGGGGRGIRRVDLPSELEAQMTAAQQEAEKFFGDSSVYIEKFLINPHHVEIQIIADSHG